MRLYLINLSKPLTGSVTVSESRWNRYRVLKVLRGRIQPLLSSVGNLPYLNNSRADRESCADFQRRRRAFLGDNPVPLNLVHAETDCHP